MARISREYHLSLKGNYHNQLNVTYPQPLADHLDTQDANLGPILEL